MTVSTLTNINRYTGNGTTTIYPYTFKVLFDTDNDDVATGDIDLGSGTWKFYVRTR